MTEKEPTQAAVVNTIASVEKPQKRQLKFSNLQNTLIACIREIAHRDRDFANEIVKKPMKEVIPIICRRKLLKNLFRTFPTRALPFFFELFHVEDLYGVNTKMLVEQIIVELHEEYQQEQHTFAAAIICQLIIDKFKIKIDKTQTSAPSQEGASDDL